MRKGRGCAVLVIVLLGGMIGGCGGAKLYVPPEGKASGTIVLINEIYRPGFYVELDGMQAGFLKDTVEVKATPGTHTLKVFNTETTYGEKNECIEHTFDLKVQVTQDEVTSLTLSWDDKGYSRETKRESKGLEEPTKKKKVKEKKPTDNLPGMPPY